MKKYLYGAAIQGIQSFIFNTNALREIVGASEIVENICTSLFFDKFQKNGEPIINAAGNIKCMYSNREECENTVMNFPRAVMMAAPGITISQAVVTFDDTKDFSNAVNELEQKLHQQRNKPMRSQTLGMLGVGRSRTTGLPITNYKQNEFFDAAQYQKLYTENDKRKNTTQKLCVKAFGKEYAHPQNIAYDIKDITGKNDWIAIIHIDGNGLGKIVERIGTDPEKFKKFSAALDKCTQEAAKDTFKELQGENRWNPEDIIPIRPVVLGGDDLTIICRGDIAIDYAQSFIKKFEAYTEQNKDIPDKLTACGGIAFIKSSYPFYYGYNLAEQLCKYAKKVAKDIAKKMNSDLAPSCIMFHKVQDSFVENFENDIAERELSPNPNASFLFGPYFLNDQETYWTIDNLRKTANQLVETPDENDKDKNALKSHLRQWMSQMHTNADNAAQHKKRMQDIFPMKEELIKELKLLTPCKRKETKEKEIYPVYDVLTYLTINDQKTK